MPEMPTGANAMTRNIIEIVGGIILVAWLTVLTIDANRQDKINNSIADCLVDSAALIVSLQIQIDSLKTITTNTGEISLYAYERSVK